MPATSQAQQRLMAMAEHHPSAVKGKNRGVLKMSHQQLHDFAATPRKGLPLRSVHAAAKMSASRSVKNRHNARQRGRK